MSEIKNVSFSFRCNENWEAMKPCKDGRHCTVCNKTVIDFSNKSEEEFIQILQLSKGEVCGKFKKESTSYHSKKIKNLPSKWLASLMLFFGFYSCNDISMYDNTLQEKNTTSDNNRQLLGKPVSPLKNPSSKKNKISPNTQANQKIDSTDLNANDPEVELGMIEMPEFISGGDDSMLSFLSKNISLRDSVYGKVVVVFKVDKEGQVKKEKILKSLSPLNDEEVLRAIKLLKFKKQKRESWCQLPVLFDPE